MDNSGLYPELQGELRDLKKRLLSLEHQTPSKSGNGHTHIEGFSLAKLVDLMPGIMYVSNFDSNEVLWANYKSLQMLGYEEEEIRTLGPLYYMSFFHPEDTDIFKNFHDFFHEKRGRCFHCSYRLKHKSGDWHWFYNSVIVLHRDVDGNPTKMLGVAVDISEQIETNDKLKELLIENLRLKSKLVASLTKREREIVKMIAGGESSKQIAATLHLSPFTIETHRKNAMSKLDVHNTAGLVRYAVENMMA